jgi:CubicO group peptidase (beta-lactamase class C family)
MRHYLILTILLIVPFTVKAQYQHIDLFASDSLDRYIIQAMNDWKIPGAAVFIVKDDKVLLQKGFGVSNWSTQQKVDEKTVFPIASISKTFTGTLFATLEAEDKVSLNDLVKRWLPEFTMKDKLYEEQITLTDVLSHRSGWKTFQGDFLNTESSLDYATMVQKFSNEQPAYPIRTKFGYSNFGFIMAGISVKTITGQDFNTYLKNRFLIPLGMNRTLTFESDINRELNIASGHTLRDDKLIVMPQDKIEPFSHGGIFSSIEDMGIWVSTLLSKGNRDDKNIIPESAINKMWLSQTIIGKSRAADREMYFKTYGLGWEIIQYQNLEIMQHLGAYSGALTSLAIVPALNLGIVVLTNQDNHALQETLKWQVIDSHLNKNVPNYSLAAIARQKKRNLENQNQTKDSGVIIEKFSIQLDAIVGTYSCEYYGKATIQKENGVYVLTLEHHPNLQGIFSYFNKSELTCTYNHPMFGQRQFPFSVENGKVNSFVLFVDDFVEVDGYEFVKIK